MSFVLLLFLGCDPDSDPKGGSADGGGKASDGGGSPDGGGTADAGTADGGGPDGGDSGATADCSALRWRDEARVLLDAQSEVDGFCAQWNAVTGDLIVDVGADAGKEGEPITQLDGIKCLCEVGGSLWITGDAARGLPPTRPPLPPVPTPPPPHVTGDIELSILERVGGDLVLTWHPALSYVESMRALVEVGGDLVIAGNPELQVASFYALERVGGRVRVQDMDKQLILRLPAARSLGGLELGSSGDARTLYYLVEVKLDQLQELRGDLRVVGPRNLPLLGAPLLERIDGALQLEAACITDLAFPSLQEVGSLSLVGNCGLLDLDGLSALRRISGQDPDGRSLRLQANEQLDAEELQAFLDQLEAQGTGKIEADNAGSCAEVMAAYGEGYCG